MYPTRKTADVIQPRDIKALNDNLPCLYRIIRSPHPLGTALTLYESRQQIESWQPIKEIVLHSEFDQAAAIRSVRLGGVECLL